MGLPFGVLPWHRSEGSHVLHKSLALDSRRLHAGHHSSSKQVPLELIPSQRLELGFGGVSTLSTRHQRFTHVRLPSTHLTGLSRLFRLAHHPSRCAGAASGSLNPSPVARVRGADPHLLCSSAASSWPLLNGLLSVAFVAHNHQHTLRNDGGVGLTLYLVHPTQYYLITVRVDHLEVFLLPYLPPLHLALSLWP